MTKFLLEIDCDGPAFHADYGDDVARALEVAHILDNIRAVLERDERAADDGLQLKDSDGRHVGVAQFLEPT